MRALRNSSRHRSLVRNSAMPHCRNAAAMFMLLFATAGGACVPGILNATGAFERSAPTFLFAVQASVDVQLLVLNVALDVWLGRASAVRPRLSCPPGKNDEIPPAPVPQPCARPSRPPSRPPQVQLYSRPGLAVPARSSNSSAPTSGPSASPAAQGWTRLAAAYGAPPPGAGPSALHSFTLSPPLPLVAAGTTLTLAIAAGAAGSVLYSGSPAAGALPSGALLSADRALSVLPGAGLSGDDFDSVAFWPLFFNGAPPNGLRGRLRRTPRGRRRPRVGCGGF